MITPETEYCTIAEAAILLHVSRPTVWRMVKSGRLSAYRVGRRSIRIRRRDIEGAAEPVALGGDERSWCLVSTGGALGLDDAIRSLQEGRARMRARRGGQPLPPTWPLIREAREERSEQL